MTRNRRIFINIISTYGRSLFSLLCGLFTTRWILNALGHEDFGLYGLVGGLTIFITFFNGLMAGATSRFYAFAVGSAQIADNIIEGLEDCRKWFNTSLMIHSILPVILICVGYPIGYKIVTEHLAIPPDKINICVKVLRFTAVACFIAMINVPFQAMYTAKQYIAELTIYSFIQTFCNFFFAWYMISHPGIWLDCYAFYMCIIQIVPQIVICIRAFRVFPECRIKFKYWGDWQRVCQMCSYAGWHAFAGIGSICRGQGIAMLVNKYFGAQVNASISIANQVSSQTQTLTTALANAFQPAITSACGAKDYDLMRSMAFKTCKFGTFLLLIFLAPLVLEIQHVLCLWLGNPPPYVATLIVCMLGVLIIDKITMGHMIAVNANGRVALYHVFLGSILILTLPVAWLFFVLDFEADSVGYALLIATFIVGIGRIFFARKLVSMSARYWLYKIALPLIVVICCSIMVGSLPQLFLEASFLRICVTTICVELFMIPFSWIVVFSSDERVYVKTAIRKIIKK